MQQSGLRVLMMSGDRNILAQGSAVSERMKAYGELVSELHIVLECDKRHGLSASKLSENVWVYPTNSVNRFLRPLDALKMASGLAPGKSLVTTQDPFECGWVGMKLKERFSLPLEVQLHTDPFSAGFSGFLNALRKKMGKQVLRQADAIRVVRSAVAELVVKRYGVNGDRVSVLPIYVDKSRLAGEPQVDLHSKYGFKHVLLAVSRLSAEKNIDTLIEALPEVPDACLVIVGAGPEEPSLRSLALNRGVDGRVFFEGWQEDLSSYYKTADVFVQASGFEGYGLSLVEAGLCGLPSVSTPVGIAADIKEIEKASEARSFSERINHLLSHKEEARRIAETVRKVFEGSVYDKDAYMMKIKEGWDKIARQ